MPGRPLTTGGENTLAAQDVIEVGDGLQVTPPDGSITPAKLAAGAALANLDDGSITLAKLAHGVLAGVPIVYGTGQAGYAQRMDRPGFYVTTGDPPAAELDPGDLRLNKE